ncbi:MAG: hypothetical protein Q4C23_01000 [Mycoplasmatota bacterium]|nr:hypothetical protein [Mycoplasmatota bacterium]
MRLKMKKELSEFRNFKKTYRFKQLKIIQENGIYKCKDILIKDNNMMYGESSKWINVGYSLKGKYPKLLSNLFPYKFKFKGYVLNSIESFFQGIKFKNKKLQKQVFKYSGKEALVLQEATTYNWMKEGIIYWRGKPIKRDSKEYDNMIDELYISAIQNRFYRNAIKNCKLPIVHMIGEDSKNETVFTRYEFEYMLNCLHAFLINKK